MRQAIAPISNIARLSAAGAALKGRAVGMPGIGLLWGPSGYGKTTAAAWWRTQVDAVYVRALRTWTAGGMLHAILRELRAEAPARISAQVERVVDLLARTGRPLLLDEADYVVDKGALVDTLRDIHDLSEAPIILIGMEHIKRRVELREQMAGRVSQWVEFRGADLSDAKLLATTLAEVAIDDELIQKLHDAAAGSVRRVVVGLSQIERRAKTRALKKIGLADWGKAAFTLHQAGGEDHA